MIEMGPDVWAILPWAVPCVLALSLSELAMCLPSGPRLIGLVPMRPIIPFRKLLRNTA